MAVPGLTYPGEHLVYADHARGWRALSTGPAERHLDAGAVTETVKHDVIYKSIRSAWLVLQSIGFFPFQRYCRGGTAAHAVREPSAGTVYSAVLYAALLAATGVVWSQEGGGGGGGSGSQDFDSTVFVYLMYLLSSVPVIVLPLYFMQRTAFAAYLGAWCELQVEFLRATSQSLVLEGLSSRSVVLVSLVAAWLAVLGGLLALLLPLSVLPLLLHSAAVSGMLTASWHLHGAAVRSTATAIALQLKRKCSAGEVDALRQLWLRVSALSSGLGRAFSLPLGSLLLLHFALLTISLYALLGQLFSQRGALPISLPALLALVLSSGLTLYASCDTGQSVADQVRGVVMDELIQMRRHEHNFSFEVRRMLEAFFSSISAMPAEVTLSGISTVNRGLFTAMLSTMVTYLVVIIQFRVSVQVLNASNSTGNGTTQQH